MSDFKAKMHLNRFRWGSAHTQLGAEELTFSRADLLAGFNGSCF